MNAICYQTVTATYRPWPQRWFLAALDAWAAWRAHSRYVAEQRTLEALSPGTLRDIGLADRVRDRHTLGAVDYERGHW